MNSYPSLGIVNHDKKDIKDGLIARERGAGFAFFHDGWAEKSHRRRMFSQRN